MALALDSMGRDGKPLRPSPFSDAAIVGRVRSGDSEAFGVLVGKYQSRLSRHIERRVKDVETAKDLSQEVWLKAYRGINTFRCDSSFSSWLFRIAENHVIDYFRKQKHAPSLEPLHEISEHHITQTAACPSRDLERAELRRHLRDAIAELPPMRRRVFLLYYHHELPIKAIAKRLCRSEGTIKTHLRNARRQLRDHMTANTEN